MQETVRTTRQQPRFTDWLRPQLRWITLPSWFLSTGMHVGLLFLLIYLAQLRSCQHDIQGDGGDSWRQVGIVTRQQAPPSESTSADTADAETADVSTESDALASVNPVEQVPAAPPIDLPQLPGISEPILGVGVTGGVTSPTLDNLVQGIMGTGHSAAASPGEPQGTSFLGASDVGSRFVYVIDKSWSMEGSALRAAKTELTASLQRLNEKQQFQVIFYSENVEVMQPPNSRFDLFWGTDSQRLDASNQYQSVQAHGGTNHFPALKRALELNPDVVFFLTDGKDPPLTAGEFASIRRLNRGARIHCIEFGTERRPNTPGVIDPDDWLQRLARENSGTYVYRNVNDLYGPSR
jgi:von Willebrand factor type A domain